MSMWKRQEIQTMLRSKRLTLSFLSLCLSAFAQDPALWKEYGLVETGTSNEGKTIVTTYRMKDLTGALAAWESLRSPAAKPCDLAPFCTLDGNRAVIASENYVLVFEGKIPSKGAVQSRLEAFPNRRDSSLPAILTFLPKQGRVPNSARYVLGPVSLRQFAPELAGAKLGFEQGAEAQVASYQLRQGAPSARFAVFDYPTPEMARLHVPDMKLAAGSHVKRSGLLVAAVLGQVSDEDADSLLGRVSYEAKITWNESPAPSPVKPLYQLLVNILYMSGLLSLICLAAGLFYAGMRVYRRKYGTLEADESMTTLHLTGD